MNAEPRILGPALGLGRVGWLEATRRRCEVGREPWAQPGNQRSLREPWPSVGVGAAAPMRRGRFRMGARWAPVGGGWEEEAVGAKGVGSERAPCHGCQAGPSERRARPGEGRQASVGFRDVATCGRALGTRLGARLSEALDGARRGHQTGSCQEESVGATSSLSSRPGLRLAST